MSEAAEPAEPAEAVEPAQDETGSSRIRQRAAFPVHTFIGLVLVGVSWALYWTLVTVWSHALFFGLWLGYILIIDGLVHRRTGTSLLGRGVRQFVLLFVLSVPLWWVFEWCNWVLHNWSYTLPAPMNRVTDILMFSLTYSTVLPALLETAQLLRSTWIFRGRWPGPRIPLNGPLAWCVSVLGVVALVLMLLFPRQLFPVVWLFPLMILDPINSRTGHGGIWSQVAQGRWRLPFLLAATGLVCGLFWELWNNWTVGVHWTYYLPTFLSHPHLFQMPLPGYLGYLPFAGSAYACYQSVRGLIAPRNEDPLGLA